MRCCTYLNHNKVLHERVCSFTVEIATCLGSVHRAHQLRAAGPRLLALRVRYGFMNRRP